MKTILVVDDEQDIQDILKFNLEKSGYAVITASSGLEALKKAESRIPDLAIVDIMMDGMDGLEVCRELQQTARVPVIFLSAKSEEVDKIVGLELGADDYITKPFSVREVISRVKAVLRRMGAENQESGLPNIIRHETLELRLESKRLFIDGEAVYLTKKEYGLLHFFLKNPGKVFSRDQIKEHVWDDETYIIDRAVDVHIRRLRSKLGSYSSIIVTYPGMGYGYSI